MRNRLPARLALAATLSLGGCPTSSVVDDDDSVDPWCDPTEAVETPLAPDGEEEIALFPVGLEFGGTLHGQDSDYRLNAETGVIELGDSCQHAVGTTTIAHLTGDTLGEARMCFPPERLASNTAYELEVSYWRLGGVPECEDQDERTTLVVPFATSRHGPRLDPAAQVVGRQWAFYPTDGMFTDHPVLGSLAERANTADTLRLLGLSTGRSSLVNDAVATLGPLGLRVVDDGEGGLLAEVAELA